MTMAALLYLWVCMGLCIAYNCEECLPHFVRGNDSSIKIFVNLTLSEQYRVQSVHMLKPSITVSPSYTSHIYTCKLASSNNLNVVCDFLYSKFDVQTPTNCHMENSSIYIAPLTISKDSYPDTDCNDVTVMILGALLAMAKISLAVVISMLQKYKKMCDTMLKSAPPHTPVEHTPIYRPNA